MLSQSTQPPCYCRTHPQVEAWHNKNTDSHSASQREDGMVAQKKRKEKKGKRKHFGEGWQNYKEMNLKLRGGGKGIEIALLPNSYHF